MNVTAFFHCYAEGQWRNSVGEYLAALEDSQFDGPLHVGYVGGADNVELAKNEFEILRPPQTWWSAPTGWEQVTLTVLHTYSQTHDGAVMYSHTKGAYSVAPFQEMWRRWMISCVVSNWHECAYVLEQRGKDAIGCHWLTAEEFPHLKVDTDYPMFGGNFWMATCEYLRTLPVPPTNRRHEAESWIGLGDPDVIDLSPGWPGSWPYPHQPLRRLVTTI